MKVRSVKIIIEWSCMNEVSGQNFLLLENLCGAL